MSMSMKFKKKCKVQWFSTSNKNNYLFSQNKCNEKNYYKMFKEQYLKDNLHCIIIKNVKVIQKH